MQRSTLWAVCVVGGLSILGAAAGVAMASAEAYSTSLLVAVLFVGTFLACGFSMQLHRRGLGGATLVGALSGAGAILGFFGGALTLLQQRGAALAASDVATLLVVAPLLSGAMGGLGTLFLARGVTRYRAQHGLAHAPK